MKTKTFQKILRRFEKLPLHFIDTSVLVEALKDTKAGKQCSEYLNRIGYNYRGALCLTVIGEFFLIIFRDVQDQTAKDLAFEFLDRLVKRNKIKFSSLKYENFNTVDRIKELDRSIEDMDAVHLANCIEDKNAMFVTLDGNMVENKTLEMNLI